MNRKTIIIITIILILLSLFILIFKKKPNIEIFSQNGIHYSSKIEGNSFQILKDGQWKNIIVKGVNMETTSLKVKEYYKWLEYIGEMNANAIRLYTIQTPDFYKALKKYNEKNEEKIYIFQGALINEGPLLDTLDAFKLDNILPYKEEISNMINAVHGKANLPKRLEHDGGKYTEDVSPYVMGWILGIEWDPKLIDNMNFNRLDKGDYNGNYVYTEEAKPFEHWLADIMDYTLSYEMDKYKWQRPISFVNWPTTDILKQPYEPMDTEDLASIDPNKIKLKNIETGFFASYHVYPYYPDFLNFDPQYTKYIDHRGKANNYAGYLNDLKKHHDIPILIAEFGIPSSRGMSLVNVHGWNKGFISEEEQGNILSSLFQDIIKEEYLGGLVYAWSDKWSNENWSDAENPDEQFGLLSFDRLKIKVDGDKKDWKQNKIQPIFTSSKQEKDKISKIYMTNDEKYLYFGIEYKDYSNLDTLIFLDTAPNQGNTTNPYNPNIKTNLGNEFIISIKDKGQSRIVVDSYYDYNYYKYGKTMNLLPEKPEYESIDNGIYNELKLVLSKGFTIPKTKQKIPFIDYETGVLKHGNGNPENNNYDSLADYCINKKDNFIEVRIPWSLLNFTDPSKLEIIGDMHVDGLESRKNIEGIFVALATYDTNNLEAFDSFPKANNGLILKSDSYLYTWETWDKPIKEKRLKKSYYILKDEFNKY